MSKRGLVIDKKTPDLLFKLNVIGKKDKDVFTTPVTHYSPKIGQIIPTILKVRKPLR